MQNQRKCEADIHFINEDDAKEVTGKTELNGYTMGGDKVAHDSDVSLAKVSYDPATKLSSYWIKVARSGMDSGHPYNPQSPTATINAGQSLARELERGQYTYKKVPKESFDLYVKFLANRNPVDFRNAQRFMN